MLASLNELRPTDTIIEIPNRWRCRPYQENLWTYLTEGGKRAIAIWHRRAGKDSLMLNWAAVASQTRVATYWHMLPQAEQARKAIWNAVNPHTAERLIDQAFPPAMRSNTNDNEMFIRFKNGSTWQVVGSDNFNSLVGTPPAGIVFSEYALADPSAWDYMRQILLENNGWAVFITTPRGDNHAKQLYDYALTDQTWFAEKLTVDDTGVFTPPQLDSELAEMQARHGPDDGRALFDQEYRCSFVAPLIGSYYARLIEVAEKQGRVTTVEVLPHLPVHSAWDLGVSDSTSIWCFQATPLGLRCVDYLEAHGQGMEFYAAWLDKRGYKGADLLPHDARQRIPVGNPPRTRIELMLEWGRKPQLVPIHHVPDGISAVRMTLPLMTFDAVKCSQGLRALRNYRRQWHDAKATFVDAPLHDWASHGSDAMRTLAMGWQMIEAPKIKVKKEIDPRLPTFEELMNETRKDVRI